MTSSIQFKFTWINQNAYLSVMLIQIAKCLSVLKQGLLLRNEWPGNKNAGKDQIEVLRSQICFCVNENIGKIERTIVFISVSMANSIRQEKIRDAVAPRHFLHTVSRGRLEKYNTYTTQMFENKTPADQQDIFRPNCSSNDIFLRLKSSHYTMKTLRGLMEKGLTLFE